MYVAQMHRGSLKRSLPRPVAARLSSALPDFELKLRVWKALYTDAAIRSYPSGAPSRLLPLFEQVESGLVCQACSTMFLRRMVVFCVIGL